jgi:hypothetical protein
MAVNCQRCGTSLGDTEWFCSFCGKERPSCPDCGADMDEEKCKRCGTPRQAPCEECGLMTSTATSKCDECGYNKEAEVRQNAESTRNKAIAGFLGGAVLAYILANSIPILGPLAAFFVGGPVLVGSAVYGRKAVNKIQNADDSTAADLSKGEEKNKSKEWRNMKREERKKMLDTAASALEAGAEVAGAYSERKKKQQKEKKLDERIQQKNEEIDKVRTEREEARKNIEEAKKMQEEAKETKKKIEESVPDVPKACEMCKTKWRGSGGIMSSKNYEELAPGKFQCQECGWTVNLG